jgi:nucleoside diphosphate kinase
MYSSCIFIIFEGEDAVKRVRDWVVKIRSHYNKSSKDTDNVMHASDMEESAKKEIEFVIEFITKSRL